MKTYRRGWALACLVLAAGCSKGEPSAGPPGGSAPVPPPVASLPAPGAGGPALPPPGSPPAAPVAPATPAVAGQPADAAMQALVDEIGKGNIAAVWYALPTKYQADVTSLKNEFAAKMDPEIWNKTFAIVGKVAKVMTEKKAMFEASKTLEAMGPAVKPLVMMNWDGASNTLTTIANSEIKTLDGLKSADVGKFVGETGSKLAGGLVQAAGSNPITAENLDKLRKSKFMLVKQDGDVATFKLIVDGKESPKEETFKRVEGKWLPAEVVDGWDAGIASAKTNLGELAIPPELKTVFTEASGKIDVTLDKMLAAPDQTAFDAAFNELLAMGQAFMTPPGSSMQGPPGSAPGGIPSTLPGGVTVPPSTTPPPTGLPGTAPAGLPPLTPPSGLPATTPPSGAPPTLTPPTLTPPTTVPPATTPPKTNP